MIPRRLSSVIGSHVCTYDTGVAPSQYQGLGPSSNIKSPLKSKGRRRFRRPSTISGPKRRVGPRILRELRRRRNDCPWLMNADIGSVSPLLMLPLGAAFGPVVGLTSTPRLYRGIQGSARGWAGHVRYRDGAWYLELARADTPVAPLAAWRLPTDARPKEGT